MNIYKMLSKLVPESSAFAFRPLSSPPKVNSNRPESFQIETGFRVSHSALTRFMDLNCDLDVPALNRVPSEVFEGKSFDAQKESTDPSIQQLPSFCTTQLSSVEKRKYLRSKKCFDDSSDESEDERQSQDISSGLLTLLCKLFKEEETSPEDFILSVAERGILIDLLYRKFFKDNSSRKAIVFLESNLESLSSEQLQEHVQEVFKWKVKKRPEENYKFVFKRALKEMKQDFIDSQKLNHKQKMNMRDLERNFYQSFFGEIAKEKGIPIERFFHPRNEGGVADLFPKSFNSEYVKAICLSSRFVSEFKATLEAMPERSKKMISFKLRLLGNKLTLGQQGESNEELLKKKEYIRTERKCKLPWTLKEVREAVKMVNNLFL